MTDYPTFGSVLSDKYGHWCVSHRRSARLMEKYDTVLTQKQYKAEHDAWINAHPAVLLAESLPDNPYRAFVIEQTRRAL